jgi:predicted Ser/Thr protein kinase
MERNRKEMSYLILSREEKVALMEAKIARAEAQVKALAETVKSLESARGSKYTPRR